MIGPERAKWIQYQGLLHSSSMLPRNGQVENSEGDGYLPMFRIRLRGSARGQGSAPASVSRRGAVPRIVVESLNPALSPRVGQASMLGDIASLQLPAAPGDAWFDRYRDNRAWQWRYERIRLGARFAATEIDLGQERGSAAARICRQIDVEQVPGASRDQCTIRVIFDQEDGWPIAARVERRRDAGGGIFASENITFERLSPEQARQQPRRH
jgi:hypothetical protein